MPVPLNASLAVLRQHLGHGLVASVLFAAGLGTSIPVVRRNVRVLMAVPLWIVRQVLRVIGPKFPPLRVFLLIFCFNTIAIFLYMLSGVLIVLPAAIAFLTGVNIGVIVLKAGEVELPSGERPLAAALAHPEHLEVAPWVSLCSLAVLVLELPSFWISVGMGIGMGRALSSPGMYTWEQIRLLVIPRATAYWTIIVPALFVSALAETAAIRGHLTARARAEEEGQGEGQAPPDTPPHERAGETDDESPPPDEGGAEDDEG
ncbi:MAG: hypothetical protein ACLF0G_15865 [Candidatus Brocadiia bacterium]